MLTHDLVVLSRQPANTVSLVCVRTPFRVVLSFVHALVTHCRAVPAATSPRCCWQSEKDGKADMLKAFKLFDVDGKGKISFKNLKAIAAELGESMSEGDLQGMMDEADSDGDGAINESEFLAVMKSVNLF